MRPIEALNEIVEKSEFRSKAALARAMGRSNRYVSGYSSNGIIPRVDTFARMIAPCGYVLIARNNESGDEIIIDYDYDDPTS